MLRVGQKLWGINKETNKEDVVEVVEINKDYFVVKYKEKKGKYPYYTLGKKFFFEPQRKKRSCENCFLRFSGVCTSISNEICEDYRAKQEIPKEERDNWPAYGDVTAYKLRDYQHFK